MGNVSGTGAAPADPGVVLRRWVYLLLALVVVSVLHYTTSPSQAWLHNIYQRLYYAPIVVGAYWFGVRGGLVTAFAAAVAYWPHIHYTWGANAPYAASQYAELVIFHAAGLLVGLLSDAQRQLTRKYRDTADSLEAANRELLDSQAQLRHADRLSALGQIAAGLAHEVRNPLAGVEGALDIVASKVADGTPEAEFTGIARRELQRLESLVSEFLSYARPRAPELRRASLHDVIDHVALLIRPEAERASVAVIRDESARLPDVPMDPEQIRQVLFNIVLNGIQASPPDGELRIRTVLHAGAAIVEVTDAGPGIPPDHRDRLFDPFFTTKSHGTGLGLAVSQRIAVAHGGRIEVGDAPAPGALVRLVLPLSEPAGVPQRP